MIAEDICLQVLDEHTKFVEDLSDISPSVLVTMETVYQKKMEGLLTDENCFKIVIVSISLVFVC